MAMIHVCRAAIPYCQRNHDNTRDDVGTTTPSVRDPSSVRVILHVAHGLQLKHSQQIRRGVCNAEEE